MTSSHLLVSCLLAVSYLQYGECTKCYVCSSAKDAKCADPMMPDEKSGIQCTSSVMKEAGDLFNAASKALGDLGFGNQHKIVDANLHCMKMDIMVDDKVTTLRSCTLPPTDSFDPCKNEMTKMSSSTAKVSFCGTCNTDYCNGAPSSFHPPHLLLLPLAALLLARYN